MSHNCQECSGLCYCDGEDCQNDFPQDIKNCRHDCEEFDTDDDHGEEAIKCGYCEGFGWIVVKDKVTGEAIQEQCERCFFATSQAYPVTA